MAFLSPLPKLTEAMWLRQLAGAFDRRTGHRSGGLLRMLGVSMLFHDEATSAPRQCGSCRAPLHFPRNAPGFPDLVFIHGRTLWLVELKADRGRLSDHQRAWKGALERVERVRYALWRPGDLDAIARELSR